MSAAAIARRRRSAGLAFGDGDGKTIFTLAVDDVTLERADVYEELTEVRLDELGVVLMEPPEPGAGWDGDWPVIC